MIPTDKNQLLVQTLCKHIDPLLDQVVLVGGCAVGFLISDKAQLLIRPTDDVDVAVEITSLRDYYKFSGQLKELGFSEDPEITCRWRKSELCLDVMPTKENILGFTNSWYPQAVESAISMKLPSDQILKHVNGPTFIATKIESFHHRGAGDFAHHDIEDIITVINGRAELPEEIENSDPSVRDYVSNELETFLQTTAFADLIPGHIRPNESRAEIVIERIRRIAGL